VVLRRLYVPERRMTFGGHLEELRQRILYSIGAVVVTAVFSFLFLQEPLVQIILRPHQQASTQRAKVVGFHKLAKGNRLVAELVDELKKLPPEACRVFVPPAARKRALEEKLWPVLAGLAKGGERGGGAEAARKAASAITEAVRRIVEGELVADQAGGNLLVWARALDSRFKRVMEERRSALKGYPWKRSAAEVTAELLPRLVAVLEDAVGRAEKAEGGGPEPGAARGARDLARRIRGVLQNYREGIDTLETMRGAKIVAIRYTEQFFTYIKVVLIFALFLSHPFILWQAWQFIGAGLYEHEQRVALQFVPFSLVLFLTGVLFGYFVLIPWGLSYLSSYGNPELVDTMLSLSAYLSLFLSLTLLLGLVFQVPLVMYFLARSGLVDPETFRRVRRYAILTGFVLGAMLTPPDPFTQIMLAGPLICLYEIGILISRAAWRRAQGAADSE